MSRFWRVVGYILLAYLIYAIIKSPGQAADVVRTIFQILADAARSIFSFFDNLLGRS
jgi:hypothetical protein